MNIKFLCYFLFIVSSFSSRLLPPTSVCNDFFMDQTNECTDCAGTGFYQQWWPTKKCFDCGVNCEWCTSPTTCGACLKGYTFTNNQCISNLVLNDLTLTAFSFSDLNGWAFENVPTNSLKVSSFRQESYLSGQDIGRVSFSKTFDVSYPHHSLTISFKLLEFMELNQEDAFYVYADNLLVYTYDPVTWSGFGPQAISFTFSHQEDFVTLKFFSEDRRIVQTPLPVRLLLVDQQKNERILSLSDPWNIALNKPTTFSTTNVGSSSSKAVDGDLERRGIAVAKSGLENKPSWKVDLLSTITIKQVRITLDESEDFTRASTKYRLTIGDNADILVNPICQQGFNTGSGFFTCNMVGRYIGIYIQPSNPSEINQLKIAEVEVYEGIENVAYLTSASQSSVLGNDIANWGPQNGVDGDLWHEWDRKSVQTQNETDPWWKTDLGSSKDIKFIRFVNDNYQDNLGGYEVYRGNMLITVGDNPDITANPACSSYIPVMDYQCDLKGQYIGVRLKTPNDYVEFVEIEAYQISPTTKNYAIRDLRINIHRCSRLCRNCISENQCTPWAIVKETNYQVSLYDQWSFQSEYVSGLWSSGQLSNNNFQSNCPDIQYGQPWLGGHSVWGPGGWFQKMYQIPAFHYKLRVEFDLLVLDHFAKRTDNLIVYADDIEVYRYRPLTSVNPGNPQQINSYTKKCGVADDFDTIDRISFEFLHSSSILKLKWVSNSSVPASVASYGISKINLGFYQCFWYAGCFTIQNQQGVAGIVMGLSSVGEMINNNQISDNKNQVSSEISDNKDNGDSNNYYIVVIVLSSTILLLIVILFFMGIFVLRLSKTNRKQEVQHQRIPVNMQTEVELSSNRDEAH